MDLEVLFTPVVHVVKHQVNGGVAARIQSLEVRVQGIILGG